MSGVDPALIDRAVSFIEELFRGNAGGHDAEHSLRVYRNALRIAEEESTLSCDLLVVSLSALLHDADDHKLFHTENNANARRFLAENRIPPEQTEQICAAVNSVSFSKNGAETPKTLEGKIVQDADRLDALGAVGIARTFAYGGEHGRPFSDSVRHFYDKLLLLKDRMNTAAGRRLAEARHAYLEEFLREYYEETGEKSPG